MIRPSIFASAVWLVFAASSLVNAQPTGSTWIGTRPDATIDLTTPQGASMLSGQWKFAEARVVAIPSRAIGADLKPSGDPLMTGDIEPKAGAADFDDSRWEVIPPPQPGDRRGSGRLSFAWFRINLTIPHRVGALDTAGTDVVFETVVDDYAEIWVDGRLARKVFGQSGGSLIRGWNAPNRVVVGRNIQPGQHIQIAIFAANGPLSEPPPNFIWFRSATLDFYKSRPVGQPVTVTVNRVHSALDELLPMDVAVEKIAGGFMFTEGPVWVPQIAGDGEGFLLFSDPNQNTIYRWVTDGQLFEYRPKSGYSGPDIGEFGQPGSNGLAVDAEGRLTICEHGNRRVTRIEHNGLVTVLADRFEGKRLNSPNDLVYRSDGALFFTDPPFGLPKFHDDPRRELDFSGVYCLKDGQLRLVARDLSGPNGLAFSPDERFLYVGNWDEKRKVVMRYDVGTNGEVLGSREFCDMTDSPGPEAIDGIKVDRAGNLYVAGPGGLWILSPSGQHLGTVSIPESVHNLAWGDADRQTLYLTAETGLYRMRLNVAGTSHQWLSKTANAGTPFIRRLDPRLDKVIQPGATVTKIADGFMWVEGPVWNDAEACLLFSDIPTNTVYRWSMESGLSEFLRPSGYTGTVPFMGREPGSNGLVFDPQGRLVLCQHGDRRIARLERDRRITPLAERFEGQRLNSPNDAVYHSRGDLYFTDPPFGLPQSFDDPAKELPHSGVYRLSTDGTLTLLTTELNAPNGIAFSGDEKTLYVSNADKDRAVWMAFSVEADGTLGAGRVFFDATEWAKTAPGVPDGMKIHKPTGCLVAAGPGGIHVFSPDGTHLGSIETGVPTSNCAIGSDGIYITANTAIYRVPLATEVTETH